jgi:hypothetical protein
MKALVLQEIATQRQIAPGMEHVRVMTHVHARLVGLVLLAMRLSQVTATEWTRLRMQQQQLLQLKLQQLRQP